MFCKSFALVILLTTLRPINCSVPLILTTWNFLDATSTAGSALDGIEKGITKCEEEQCDGSVGWGNKFDENGETTLDAMIMDGLTHDVGSVGCLRRVKNAIGVARKVLEHTNETLLVGELAPQFALSMGFKEENLTNAKSRDDYQQWKQNNCQPNFWKNTIPDARQSCGPYKPRDFYRSNHVDERHRRDRKDHDTIGMVAIDKQGIMAVGTSTNGAGSKIPGRVGDSPIVVSGAYVDQNVGGAAQTGDGDVMMRFAPTFLAVELMRSGMSPKNAADEEIFRIAHKYPSFQGAIVVTSNKGEFAASCWGLGTFPFSAANQQLGNATLFHVKCLNS